MAGRLPTSAADRQRADVGSSLPRHRRRGRGRLRARRCPCLPPGEWWWTLAGKDCTLVDSLVLRRKIREATDAAATPSWEEAIA